MDLSKKRTMDIFATDIFRFLKSDEIMRFGSANHALHNMCTSSYAWKRLDVHLNVLEDALSFVTFLRKGTSGKFAR